MPANREASSDAGVSVRTSGCCQTAADVAHVRRALFGLQCIWQPRRHEARAETASSGCQQLHTDSGGCFGCTWAQIAHTSTNCQDFAGIKGHCGAALPGMRVGSALVAPTHASAAKQRVGLPADVVESQQVFDRVRTHLMGEWSAQRRWYVLSRSSAFSKGLRITGSSR
jgi:hypothetical protein